MMTACQHRERLLVGPLRSRPIRGHPRACSCLVGVAHSTSLISSQLKRPGSDSRAASQNAAQTGPYLP